jgi:acyl-CoA synthetase (AMP-forming)/AMP-acid ligase II
MDYSYPLLCSCERNAQRTAIVGHEATMTYAQLERGIAGLAAGLREGGMSGKRVGSLLLNEPETVELYMALSRVGAVSVPVNTRLTTEEKRYILENAGVSLLVVDDEFLDEAQRLRNELPSLSDILCVLGTDGFPSLRDLRRTDPEPPPSHRDGEEDEPATIIYTSGTTGFPKGVIRSHRANVWNCVNSALGSPRRTEDVELFNLPIFGIGFLHFAMPALLGGATLVLDRSFAPERAWELLERHRVTRTFLAPTMIAAMLEAEGQEERDIESLELIYTAYAFPERLRQRALNRFGDRFVYMYGLTEAQLTCARPGEFAAKPTSVGKTMGVARLRIVADDGSAATAGSPGEIAMEGPFIMSGYHELTGETGDALRDGWVHTGDLGYIDDDGDLHYAGRSKEMIKTGGFSVDPVEVENAILTLEAVREAAALGVEDERWGEMVVAFVSPSPATNLSGDEVIRVCRERIAGYKTPKRVFVVDALPKNPTGKVERGVLRRMYHELASEAAPASLGPG